MSFVEQDVHLVDLKVMLAFLDYFVGSVVKDERILWLQSAVLWPTCWSMTHCCIQVSFDLRYQRFLP